MIVFTVLYLAVVFTWLWYAYSASGKLFDVLIHPKYQQRHNNIKKEWPSYRDTLFAPLDRFMALVSTANTITSILALLIILRTTPFVADAIMSVIAIGLLSYPAYQAYKIHKDNKEFFEEVEKEKLLTTHND